MEISKLKAGKHAIKLTNGVLLLVMEGFYTSCRQTTNIKNNDHLSNYKISEAFIPFSHVDEKFISAVYDIRKGCGNLSSNFEVWNKETALKDKLAEEICGLVHSYNERNNTRFDVDLVIQKTE